MEHSDLIYLSATEAEPLEDPARRVFQGSASSSLVDRQKIPVRWRIGRRFQLVGGQERIPATGLAPEIPPDSVHVHQCQSGSARSATTGPRAAGWGRISGLRRIAERSNAVRQGSAQQLTLARIGRRIVTADNAILTETSLAEKV
jgi:hypothetical protein